MLVIITLLSIVEETSTAQELLTCLSEQKSSKLEVVSSHLALLLELHNLEINIEEISHYPMISVRINGERGVEKCAIS